MSSREQIPEPAGPVEEPAEQERRLIEQAREGDQRAFEALLRLHDRRVFAIIGMYLKRRQDVEDLAQEVFLKAYLAMGRFRPGAPFAPWLNRIAVNTCYDHLRKIRRRPEVALADLSDREEDVLYRLIDIRHPSGNQDGDRLAARDLAERLLATLPPKDRLAITLREVQGFDFAEIANALGCTRPAAKVRVFRARRAMHAALQRLIRQEDQMANRLPRRERDDLS